MAGKKKPKRKSRRNNIISQISSFAKRAPRLILYGVSALSGLAKVKQCWDEGGGDWGQFSGRLQVHFTGVGTDGRFYWQAPAATYLGIGGPLVVNKAARSFGVW